MSNEITDINDLVSYLTWNTLQPLLNDNTWKNFGYRKRPRHGQIWHKVFPRYFKLQDYLLREILVLALIDVLNGIKGSNEKHDIKLLLCIGVIDRILSSTEYLFDAESLMEYILYSYEILISNNVLKSCERVFIKAKNKLEGRDLARFMVGAARLMAFGQSDYYLLKIDSIKDIIEKSGKNNRLKISMHRNLYEKYVPLIEENILFEI